MTRSETKDKAYFVYLLQCGDGSLYCGITNDREKRLRAHNEGTASRYTRSRLPVRMVYSEEVPDKPAALRRELAIKALTRKQKLALIEAHNTAEQNQI